MLDEKERESLRAEAERQIAAQPEHRVFSFTYKEEKYWIKRKLGNHRKQFGKYSVEKEFRYEAAHLQEIARGAVGAPELVVLTDTYMVLTDGGKNLNDFLQGKHAEEEKLRALYTTGKTLARLHTAGYFHGRPALRDIAWDGENITFVDWESRTYFRSLIRRQMTDVFILVQGMYREPWMREDYVAAAWAGYSENGGAPVIEEARNFLKKHGSVYRVCRALHPFHFKDVESMEKACKWLKKQ